jgi:hypothetical protein
MGSNHLSALSGAQTDGSPETMVSNYLSARNLVITGPPV